IVTDCPRIRSKGMGVSLSASSSSLNLKGCEMASRPRMDTGSRASLPRGVVRMSGLSAWRYVGMGSTPSDQDDARTVTVETHYFPSLAALDRPIQGRIRKGIGRHRLLLSNRIGSRESIERRTVVGAVPETRRPAERR